MVVLSLYRGYFLTFIFLNKQNHYHNNKIFVIGLRIPEYFREYPEDKLDLWVLILAATWSVPMASLQRAFKAVKYYKKSKTFVSGLYSFLGKGLIKGVNYLSKKFFKAVQE